MEWISDDKIFILFKNPSFNGAYLFIYLIRRFVV